MYRKALIATILICSMLTVFAAANMARDSILYQLGRIDQQIDMLNAQKTELLRQLKEIDSPSTGTQTIQLKPPAEK